MNCNSKGTAKKFESHTIFHPSPFTNTAQRVKNQIWSVFLIYFAEVYLKSSWRSSEPGKLVDNLKNAFLHLQLMCAWCFHRSTLACGAWNSSEEILKEEKIGNKIKSLTISSSCRYEIVYKVKIWLWLCLRSLDLVVYETMKGQADMAMRKVLHWVKDKTQRSTRLWKCPTDPTSSSNRRKLIQIHG